MLWAPEALGIMHCHTKSSPQFYEAATITQTLSLRHRHSKGFGDLPKVTQCQVADPGQEHRLDFHVHAPFNIPNVSER